MKILEGATVTLNGVTINQGTGSSGIRCAEDVTLILKGNNTISSKHNSAISVAEGKTLTIQGDGSLTATGGNNYQDSDHGAAAIGGLSELNQTCGNIIIDGGTIKADGGNQAAGIGAGYNGSCGNITINGGIVTARGGKKAAGIGGGYVDDDKTHTIGNIAISYDVVRVTATKGDEASYCIGLGNKSGSQGYTCGDITVGEKSYGEQGIEPNGKPDNNSYTYAQQIKVTLTGGANSTIAGKVVQLMDIGDAMDTVTYTANSGYYFEQFNDVVKDGITVKWVDPGKVQVSGTPAKSTDIPVPDAVKLSYKVSLSGGANATAVGGDMTQSVIAGEKMASVSLIANKKYHFESFQQWTQDGITVNWKNSSEIEVYGTPTGSCTISLPDAAADAKNPSITLNTSKLVLQKGKTSKTIKATVKDDTISSAQVLDAKKKKDIIKKVSVNTKTGVLTIAAGKKIGSAKIKVNTESGKSKTLEVKVQKDKVTTKKLTLKPTSVTLSAGNAKNKTKIVTATATPDYYSTKEKITISGYNKKIVKCTVDKITGKITLTGLKKGKTTVTVKAGKKKASLKVKVNK